MCEFPEDFYDCAGNCLSDIDGDGVCDQLEIVGCQDALACNYNADATDAGFCSYPIANFDCDGNSLRPMFTSFPANGDVDACNVPSVEDAVVEAMFSPFAPAFEAAYNDNECYDVDMDVEVAFVGEIRLDGDCANNYVLVRSWSATDCAGYTRVREQILNVSDTTAPSLTIPSDQSISCDLVDDADFGMAVASDDCGDVEVSMDVDSDRRRVRRTVHHCAHVHRHRPLRQRNHCLTDHPGGGQRRSCDGANQRPRLGLHRFSL